MCRRLVRVCMWNSLNQKMPSLTKQQEQRRVLLAADLTIGITLLPSVTRATFEPDFFHTDNPSGVVSIYMIRLIPATKALSGISLSSYYFINHMELAQDSNTSCFVFVCKRFDYDIKSWDMRFAPDPVVLHHGIRSRWKTTIDLYYCESSGHDSLRWGPAKVHELARIGETHVCNGYITWQC